MCRLLSFSYCTTLPICNICIHYGQRKIPYYFLSGRSIIFPCFLPTLRISETLPCSCWWYTSRAQHVTGTMNVSCSMQIMPHSWGPLILSLRILISCIKTHLYAKCCSSYWGQNEEKHSPYPQGIYPLL